MSKAKTLPPRSQVAVADTWNLQSLFRDDAAWERSLLKWEKQLPGYERFRGKLGSSARTLRDCLVFDAGIDRAGERLGVYASLRAAEDQAASDAQRMRGRFQHLAAKAAELSAFIRPEILSIPAPKMKRFLADTLLRDWKLTLERIVRFRPHTLKPREEKLLAMQAPMASAAANAFTQLNNADLKWPMIRNEKGERIELSHSTYSSLIISPKRSVRQRAFVELYKQYDAHRHTIAATLNGSVQRDVYYAKVRGYDSSLSAALFPDNIPKSAYDNLIATVRANLPSVHRYFELRRRAMKLRDIHHYDTYVPILAKIETRHTWEQAAKLVVTALAPLGDEYCRTLHEGLTTARWCDRYPNAGKQSGAFSYGSYDALPYIMMNYQPSVLDHVFTLAHEAGHSMHSWFSGKHQPFQYYHYTIFVAEVASTFNEQLLLEHLLKHAKSKQERAYLLNHAIDEIRGTIVRQTMFAEFEKVIHELAEKGEPLTIEALRREYRALLDAYFGPRFTIDPQLELECLRIPHFYRAFYVYKYATGLSAAIALARRVLTGGRKELADYLRFLSSGCSKDPLDLLRDAGVDMASPQPVESAMRRFTTLVEELEALL